MFRRLRLAGLPIAAALLLAGCPSNDAKASDVVNAMEDAGLDEDEATCIGEGFDAEFGDDQDLFNDLAAADDPEDFPEGTEEAVTSIIEECTSESAAGDGDGGEGDGGDAESDATTTTEGDGEGG
jgi:hypothetical protein